MGFLDLQELDDYSSECAPMVLSIDGLARSTEVILACKMFVELTGKEWSMEKYEVNLEKIRAACGGAGGISFENGVLKQINECATLAGEQLVRSLMAGGWGAQPTCGGHGLFRASSPSIEPQVGCNGAGLSVRQGVARRDVGGRKDAEEARGDVGGRDSQNFPTVKKVQHAAVELATLAATTGKHDLPTLCGYIQKHMNQANEVLKELQTAILGGTIALLSDELANHADMIATECGCTRGHTNNLSWAR